MTLKTQLYELPKPSQALLPSAEVTHPLQHILQVSPFILMREDKPWQVSLPPFAVGLWALISADSTARSGCSWGAGTSGSRWEQSQCRCWNTWPSPSCHRHRSCPFPCQQRCYWYHCKWAKKRKRITAELTKGDFDVQTTPRGYLWCSSSRTMYLMKQWHGSFHVICTFC